MTQFISDREQISDLTRRRHTDPPELWIVVATVSVLLHFIIFWLLRSSALSSLSFQHSKQARSTSIELVEVPLKGKKKSVRRKTTRQSITQKSAPITPPVKPKVVEKPANQKLIAATQPTQVPAPQPPKAPQSTSTQITATPPKSKKFTPKPIVTPKTTSTPSTVTPSPTPPPPPPLTPPPDPTGTSTPPPPPNPTGTSTPPPPPNPTGTSTPPPNPTGTSTPPPPPDPTGTSTPPPPPPPPGSTKTSTPPPQKISSGPTTSEGKKPTESKKTIAGRPTNNRSPLKFNPIPGTGGGLIAISHTLPRSEQMAMLQQRKLTGDAPPKHLAQYQGSGSIPIDPTWLGVSFKLPPATILANLAIDQDGKFVTASMIEIRPPSLQGQKEQYEKLLDRIYQNQKFKPGFDIDAKDPITSNLLVRITIK